MFRELRYNPPASYFGEVTISVTVEDHFLVLDEFYVGLKLRLEGRLAVIKSINLYGGKSVKSAYAIDIVRVTCRYIDERRK